MKIKTSRQILYYILLIVVVFIETKYLPLRLSLALALGMAYLPVQRYFKLAWFILMLGHAISKPDISAAIYSASDFIMIASYYYISNRYRWPILKLSSTLLKPILASFISCLLGSLILLITYFSAPTAFEYFVATQAGLLIIFNVIYAINKIDILYLAQKPLILTSAILFTAIFLQVYFSHAQTQGILPYAGLFLSSVSFFLIRYLHQIGILISLFSVSTVTFVSYPHQNHYEVWLSAILTTLLITFMTTLAEKNQELYKNKSTWSQESEKLKKMQTLFLATMSHELRTPLTAIMGYTDLLIEKNPLDKKELSVMKKNEEFLLDMLNAILNFSKISLHEKHIRKEKINVIEMLNETQHTFMPLAKQRNLMLKFDCNLSPSFCINLDKTAIKEILNNLISNALKFTPKGTVTVTTSTRTLFNRTMLIFLIEDTGIGIASNKIKNLFTPFYQVESSMSRNYGGIGLGLAITAKLVENLNGKISVTSQKMRGTCFNVEIPVTVIPPEIIEDQPQQVKKLNKLPLIEKKILVVDDSADNTDLMSHFLRSAHMNVDIAENGKIAVDRVLEKHSNFDLILMDMQMPVMDGYQATKLLRHRGYKTPIIAITAHATSGDKEKCIAAGCTDYISKPFTKETFINTVSTYLNASQQLHSH